MQIQKSMSLKCHLNHIKVSTLITCKYNVMTYENFKCLPMKDGISEKKKQNKSLETPLPSPPSSPHTPLLRFLFFLVPRNGETTLCSARKQGIFHRTRLLATEYNGLWSIKWNRHEGKVRRKPGVTVVPLITCQFVLFACHRCLVPLVTERSFFLPRPWPCVIRESHHPDLVPCGTENALYID